MMIDDGDDKPVATCGDPGGLLGGNGLSRLVEHPPGVLVCLQLGESCNIGREGENTVSIMMRMMLMMMLTIHT
jgi:hypothetical protein